MPDRDRCIDTHFALIVVAVMLVLIYGSLYPFHFQGNPDHAGPLRALIRTWRGPIGRGDFLANVRLYLPFGLFSAQTIRRSPPVARITIITFSGVALSVCMEPIQFYDEGRVSALADVYANTIGVALGAAIGPILFHRSFARRISAIDRRPFVILLLSCWVGDRLFPYLPVIDLHKYWTAVKPLLFSPALTPPDLYHNTMMWLVVAVLIEALVGIRQSRGVLPLLFLIVLFARILIVDAMLSPAEVTGGALAVVLWLAFLSRLQMRASVVAILFAGAVVVEGIEPVAHPFGWVPFRSFLHGSLEVNVCSFLEKAFNYGALVWLIVRTGSGLRVAAIVSGGLVLCLRLIQMFLPGRSAEITDPVMVLLVCAVMKSMGELPARVSQSASNESDRRDGLFSRAYEGLTRNDPVQPVDIILVLAGRLERKLYGLELYRMGLAPRMVLSVGRFEVSKMAQLNLECIDELKSIRDETAPGERHFFVTMDGSGVHLEKTNLHRWSTYGETLAFRHILERQAVRRAMVVSTDIHLRRAALTFTTLFRDTPVEFLYCAVPTRLAIMTRDNWWRRPADRSFVISEIIKLTGYRVALSTPGWVARRLMQLTGWGRKK